MHIPRHSDHGGRVVVNNALRTVTVAVLCRSPGPLPDRALSIGLADPADSWLSGVKLHRHGFFDCFDTEDCVLHWLERMQRENLLPR